MTSPELRLDTRLHSRNDLERGARLCARAFYDDPFFSYLLTDDRHRLRALHLIHRALLLQLGDGGHIVTVVDSNDQIQGIAAWLTTDHYPQSVRTQLAQLPGMLRAFARTPRSFLRGQTCLTALAKVHPHDAQWYLCLLATDPPAQRRGVGTLLMNEGLEHVDREGVGSYLETQKPENLAYYRRFGYELRDTLTPLGNGPALYTMWRAPR